MCQTPLVLAMYVANDQRGRSNALPATRSEFYRLVVDELLVHRRNRPESLGPGQSRLRDQREELLGEIALSHLLDTAQSANSIDYDMAIRIVANALGIANDESARDELLRLSMRNRQDLWIGSTR